MAKRTAVDVPRSTNGANGAHPEVDWTAVAEWTVPVLDAGDLIPLVEERPRADGLSTMHWWDELDIENIEELVNALENLPTALLPRDQLALQHRVKDLLVPEPASTWHRWLTRAHKYLDFVDLFEAHEEVKDRARPLHGVLSPWEGLEKMNTLPPGWRKAQLLGDWIGLLRDHALPANWKPAPGQTRADAERVARDQLIAHATAGGVATEAEVWKAYARVEAEATAKIAAGGTEEWPEPAPLPAGLPPVPSFDVEALLPPTLAPWVMDIAERMSCPPDFPGVAAVGVAATLVGRQIAIRPKRQDSWEVVPNLYGVIVGRPGVLKSPALKAALAPLYRLAKDARLEYEQAKAAHVFEKAEWEARQKAREEALKKLIKEQKSTEGQRAAWADVPALVEPTPRRYLTNDTTVEKLGVILNENPNGVLLFRDELGGWLRILERDGHQGDREFYCEAWDGGNPYTYDRIGRGTLYIEACCLSILGSIQPGPLQGYLREVFGGGKADDGLIQRFQLAVYPDRQPQRIVDRYPDSQAAARANGVYARLARLNLTTLGAEHFSPEERAFLRFDGGGQRVFDAWLAGLMTRLDADEEHPVVVSHLSKHRSLMPSLALLLHLMEAVDQPPELLPGRRGAVSHAAAQRAVAWCEYLEAHARRLYASVTDGAALAAKLLSTKLRRGDLKNPFRAREIFKKGWAGLTEKESVYPALGLLEELGWVRPEVERGEKGGRPTILYWINPKLLVGESPS